MRIAILAIVFVVFDFAIAQNVTRSRAAKRSKLVVEVPRLNYCWMGYIRYNGTGRVKFQRTQACAIQQTRCQVKVEVRPTSYHIYKECKEPNACKRNRANNPVQCFSEEAIGKRHRVCHYCCKGRYCNTDSIIQVKLPRLKGAKSRRDKVKKLPLDELLNDSKFVLDVGA